MNLVAKSTLEIQTLLLTIVLANAVNDDKRSKVSYLQLNLARCIRQMNVVALEIQTLLFTVVVANVVDGE